MLVGHHGSKNSTSKQWLDYVKPKMAVISVGKNGFGHPNREVIGILDEYGVKVFRTNKDGDILVKL